MAINIQEILHPSDSDSIKFAKINYNFDQILANGGGPVGPKGQKGNQGVVGQTGDQGIQGEKGTKGDSGETTSPWKSIAIDLNTQDGVDNLTILKPKPDTDLETPVIWLGDSSFVNSGQTLNDGDTTLRSTLNVSRHYDINNSAVNAEYMTFWHDANNKIKLDSEDQSGYVRFNLSPVTPLVGSAPDIRFQINIPTIHTETFRLDNMAATGVLASGMVRYNSGGQKFEGYIDGAWVEFCTAPCGSGGTDAISFSPVDDLTLNADGTPFGDSISFAPAGDLTLNNDGTVASSTLPVITNFDAYAMTGSSTEIECYWDSISDSTDVTITWGTGGSFTNVGSYTVTNYGSDTYTITGLTASTAYSIRMTATNANGNDVEERTATTEAAATTTTTTLPLFECSDTNIQISNGAVGANVLVNMNGVGSAQSVSPATYQLGQQSYTVTVNVPAGYSNSGGTIPCDVSGTGTTTQAPVYTVSYWEQASHTSPAICDATTSNYTMDYPTNLANSGAAFRSYFESNYTPNAGTTRSVKIISSTEPNFQSASWTIRMDDDGNTDINWADCSITPSGYGPGEVQFRNYEPAGTDLCSGTGTWTVETLTIPSTGIISEALAWSIIASNYESLIPDSGNPIKIIGLSDANQDPVMFANGWRYLDDDGDLGSFNAC